MRRLHVSNEHRLVVIRRRTVMNVTTIGQAHRVIATVVAGLMGDEALAEDTASETASSMKKIWARKPHSVLRP